MEKALIYKSRWKLEATMKMVRAQANVVSRRFMREVWNYTLS
jgi:hypothetical protein